MKRKIIEIDEEKCNGCGQCIDACVESALELVDGKAKLVGDILCDGLGACLGECPQDALKIIERDAVEFDEAAVEERVAATKEKSAASPSPPAGGCPGSRALQFSTTDAAASDSEDAPATASALGQWPIQLTLLPPTAPYFKEAELLVVADCVPVAVPDFHYRFLKGKAIAVGCPKLDNTAPYVEKLKDIIAANNLKLIKVLHMEVPCCSGLKSVVTQAREQAGVSVPVEAVKISVRGEILEVQAL